MPTVDGEDRGDASVVAVALGSNLGDRLERLRDAVRGLRDGGVRVVAASSVYESAPAGHDDQPDYLNAVVVGATRLTPGKVLELARELEARAGRERSFRNAPRTLDVDIVLYGELSVDEPGLRIPHARWRQRPFVVVPLAEAAPELRDPEADRTVKEVRASLPPHPPLRRVATPEALLGEPDSASRRG